MPASEEPTVMEELVEERVVLEPHHLNEGNFFRKKRVKSINHLVDLTRMIFTGLMSSE